MILFGRQDYDAEGIDDGDADDIERPDKHGDGGAFLIWGGTDLDACAVTLSPDAFHEYNIDVILRQHFDVGGYEANRSNRSWAAGGTR